MDGLEYRVMQDPAAKSAAFFVGQIEHGVNVQNEEQWNPLLAEVPDALINCDIIVSGVYATMFNRTREKFQDERVRQALLLATDRERIAQIFLGGWGGTVPMFGWPFIFDSTPSGDELGPWYRYDPSEAKKMLAAAGAEDLEWEGVFWGGSQQGRVAVLQDIMSEVGVTLTTRQLDSAAWFENFFGRKWLESTDAIFSFVAGQSPSATGFFYENVNSQSGKNYFGLDDPEIDGWADAQRGEQDPDSRKELLRRIWDKTLASAYSLDTPTAFRTNVFQPWVRYYRFNGP